jgi:REP element-mobilizing transposase RayT
MRRRGKKPGRKKNPDSGVPHLRRSGVSDQVPVHVTLRIAEGLPDLRDLEVYEVFWRAFEEARERPGRSREGWFRLVHFSLQGNHVHLIVEASERDALSRGLNGLCVRLARRLNKLWKRTGKVFGDRFHHRVLRTPKEVYNALRYIFDNARKHGRGMWKNRPDPFSSGLWFSGWRDYVHYGWVAVAGPVAQAGTWLLAQGWRRHGLLVLRP